MKSFLVELDDKVEKFFWIVNGIRVRSSFRPVREETFRWVQVVIKKSSKLIHLFRANFTIIITKPI